MIRRQYFSFLLAMSLFIGVPAVVPQGSAAWAQFTGDDNFGGNDQDHEGSNSFDRVRERTGGNTRPRPNPPVIVFEPIPVQPPRIQRPVRIAPTPTPPPQPAPPQIVLPEFAEAEIVTANLSVADLQTLLDQGFAVIEETEVLVFGLTLRRLSFPGTLTIQDALAIVRGLASGQDADLNHFYRFVQGIEPAVCQGAQCADRLQVGWPTIPSRDVACGRGIEIGMIDSGINDRHSTFAGALLELHRLASEENGALPGGNVHGTSVAALLVGDPSSRSPGLVPGASLVAVDAFQRIGEDTRTDVVTLIKGLGLLAERQVKVINLSLAGPDNSLLAGVIGQLTLGMDVVVVAAVGNDGPDADPAYPAAYGPVIAVTGVDRSGNIYEQAVRGEHVDLSAPGVEVWTAASIKGARWKTGTSFAAPFVSAAAAIMRQTQPDLHVTEVVAALQEAARDLGDPGRDPVFGAGLLNLGSLCDGQL